MKKVAVFGQVYKEEDKEYVLQVIDILTKANASVSVYKQYADEVKDAGLDILDHLETYNQENNLDTSFDALVTLGGDGTILRALDQIKHLNIPVLGINLGRLGFLATIQKDTIDEAMQAFFNNQYAVEERVMLNVKSNEKRNEFVDIGYALNDLTIAKKNTTSMIGVEAYLNNEYLTTYWADGLIISTPTGSTGYSLSCQGPVMMPNTHNFLITPVAPHNLNARPIVISNTTEIKLKVLRREDQFLASLDSRVITMEVETELIVTKAEYTAKIIVLKNQAFIKTLREKLLWGEDTRNKYIAK